MTGVSQEPKPVPDSFEQRAYEDRALMASLPKDAQPHSSWCSVHDCRLTTCFERHHPEGTQ